MNTISFLLHCYNRPMKVKNLPWLLCILLLSVFSGCSEKEAAPPPEITTNEFILPDPAQYGTAFTAVPETKDVVMYEVNIRAFSAEGDLQGVINRLDNIRALGVNVIWLMPVFPVGTINSVNSPYCVKNYREVNTEFGTLADLRNLTNQAHQRGMAVVLDWVANHTAWDNPWMKYTEWYTQVDGAVVPPPGTNWLDVADLNFNAMDMRSAMISAMKYWVFDANVDGFRCDAADMVPYVFWKQAVDSLNAIPGRKIIMLAEGSRSDHFTAGFQMNYAWDFYATLKSVFSGQAATGLYSTHSAEYSGIPAGKHKLRFTTNHDESAWDATPIVLFGGKDGAMAASVIATCMGGVPMIYGSQEVGRSSTLPFFTNSPITWSENQDMLADYQALMSFYNGSEAMKTGITRSFGHNDLCVFTRSAGSEEILVIANVRNSQVSYTLPTALQNTMWTDVFSHSTVNLGSLLLMAGYDYRVLRKQTQ